MRYAEYALLLIPVAVIVAWFYGIRGLSLRGVAAFLVLFAIVGGTLYLFGRHRVFNGTYVPAHLEGGRIVPGESR
jgi:uncharacterized iron-regulated membrane protein